MNTNSPIGYQWQIMTGEPYTFNNKSTEDQTNNDEQQSCLYFVRIKNQAEKIYTFDRILGEGIDGAVYQLSADEGKPKAIKWVDDQMDELYFLQKIYLTAAPEMPANRKKKLCGIELCPKWISAGKQYSYKIMPKYNGDLSKLFKEVLPPYLAELSIRQLTEGLVTINNCQIAAFDLKPENVLYRFRNGQLRFDLSDFGSATHNLDTCTDTQKRNKIRFNYSLFQEYLIKEIISNTGKEHFTNEFLNALESDQIQTAEDLHQALAKMETILV